MRMSRRAVGWGMLMLACALSGCATELTQNARLAKTQKTGFSPAELAQDTDEQDAVLTQFRRRAGLNAGATIATDWDAIIAAGMQYADVKCEKYMGSLERLNRDKKTITSEIGLVGGATAGIMAAAKSAAQDVALAAIAFGLAGSTIDNLGGNVLYEVEPSSVRVLVKTLQANYRATLTTGYATRPAAMGVVLAYDALCTPMTIEAELNLAIKKAQPNVKAGDPDTGKAPSVTNADTALREKYLPGASGQSLNEYVYVNGKVVTARLDKVIQIMKILNIDQDVSPVVFMGSPLYDNERTAAVQLLQLTR